MFKRGGVGAKIITGSALGGDALALTVRGSDLKLAELKGLAELKELKELKGLAEFAKPAANAARAADAAKADAAKARNGDAGAEGETRGVDRKPATAEKKPAVAAAVRSKMTTATIKLSNLFGAHRRGSVADPCSRWPRTRKRPA